MDGQLQVFRSYPGEYIKWASLRKCSLSVTRDTDWDKDIKFDELIYRRRGPSSFKYDFQGWMQRWELRLLWNERERR